MHNLSSAILMSWKGVGVFRGLRSVRMSKRHGAPPALADWNAYAHFAPNDLVVWIMAAETYLDVGEMKFAEQCIAIALSIDPEHADVRQLEREFKERQLT